MAGIDNLKSSSVAVAKCLNVASKVLNKQGLWHLLELQEPISVLSKVDLASLKAEILDLQDSERKEVEDAFKGALDLVNKDVQVKIGAAFGLVEEAVAFVESAVTDLSALYVNGKDLYLKARAFLGV